MARRDLLTGDERRALFGVPLDHASLAKHYTVADEDRPLIEAKRGDANRLGFALQLCAFRFPGRLLRPGEAIPEAALRFVAEQVGIGAGSSTACARRSASGCSRRSTAAASSRGCCR